MLEGVRRNLGVAVNKKLPVEGKHIRAWMMMQPPKNEGVAWTGEWSALMWFEFVAMAVMAWAAFLRVSELRALQLCDLEWREALTPEQFHITRQGGTERAFTGVYYASRPSRWLSSRCTSAQG